MAAACSRKLVAVRTQDLVRAFPHLDSMTQAIRIQGPRARRGVDWPTRAAYTAITAAVPAALFAADLPTEPFAAAAIITWPIIVAFDLSGWRLVDDPSAPTRLTLRELCTRTDRLHDVPTVLLDDVDAQHIQRVLDVTTQGIRLTTMS
jgi:hypothetical protein